MIQTSEYIEQYSINIEYNSVLGSGVLIKIDNFYYLMTAKHNFKKRDRDTYKNILIKDIDITLIKAKTKDNQELNIKNIIYHYKDLILFLVEGNFKKIDNIRVLKGKANDNMKYFFYGYPAFKRDGHFIDNLSSRYEKDEIFILNNINKDRIKSIEGFSGSGVFTKKNEVYYLCGILLQAEDTYTTLNIFNLSLKIDEINLKLEKKNYLPIRNQENYYFKEIDSMYNWIIGYHRNNFLVKDIQNYFGENHEYTELINRENRLKNFNHDMINSNEFDILEAKYTQELADMYLLGAFISSKSPNREESLKYLDKARYFRPEYIIFLAEIDKENSKEELFKEGKLNYADAEYNSSYNIFQKILSLNLEENEEILVYEYLVRNTKEMYNKKEELLENYNKLLNLYNENSKKIKIYYELLEFYNDNTPKKIQVYYHLLGLHNDNTKKIEIYYELLKLYKNNSEKVKIYNELLKYYENNPLEKAKIYYKISDIVDTSEEKALNLKKGIHQIEYHIDGIEIKYLLYKRLYELNEDKNDFIKLKSTLEKLVKIEPKYKYELSTLNYGETLKKIGLGSYISSLIVLYLVLSLVSLTKLWIIDDLAVLVVTLFFSIVALVGLKMTRFIFWFNIIILICSLLYLLYLSPIELWLSKISTFLK